MNEIFVGDVGTALVLDCGVDVSTSTVRKVVVKKPDGRRVQWTATLEGTTAIKYVTQAGDVDVPGEWSLQAYVEMSGWKGKGGIATLKVKNAI